LFKAGDDIAAAIADAIVATRQTVANGDVLVVAQKIVSKAEGRSVDLSNLTPTTQAEEIAGETNKNPAMIQAILSESQEIMRTRSGVVIARHRLGHVAANAGIDLSNFAGDDNDDAALRWPSDPDASATRLRSALEKRFGVRLAVIVSDSLGRAWRMGTIGSAIGVAGMRALEDRRGEKDLLGRTLQSTIVGRADEIAAAASIVIGEGAEATPAALVKGAVYTPSDEGSSQELVRPIADDLFR
jgi:coenzyme F420-0:L-glutamate ligase/coenzyme F420-1:gamma-L-glutamate ligase